MSKNYMSRNDELHRGDYLESNNRRYKAIFQDDSNFVIYGPEVVWASGTPGASGFRLVLQDDCNLVMYDSNDVPLWATNTGGKTCTTCHLRLTNDGNLQLYRGATQIWSST